MLRRNTFVDSAFGVVNSADQTKQIQLLASGITTGTTRTATMPDASGILTLLGNASTGSGVIVLATSPTFVTQLTTPKIVMSGSLIIPSADSAAAVQIDKADGVTNVVTIDTTNARMGIGTTSPAEILHLSKITGNFTTIRFDSGATQGYFFAYDGDPSINIGSNSNAAVNFKVNNSTKATLNTGGNFDLVGHVTTYDNIVTAGKGTPAIYGYGRSTAQTGAVTSVATYTVGASDGSFIVSTNVLVTVSTAHSFTVQVTYTDEGNTSRTVTFNVQQLGGTLVTSITNVTGVGPYEGVPLHIRAKAATAITIKTSGTFTTVTYNIEGSITQIS